jgi:MarR family transcriptional regulator, lower aerobic nicotinate degradation pathway regulator
MEKMAVKAERNKERGRKVTKMSREEAIVQFARSGYDLDTHPAHLVRRVHQRATQQFQQVMEGESLSPTQFAALVTILKHGAISQNHLGRLTSMDPSTISVVIKKLISGGLVLHVKSEADQRLTILTLSEEGQSLTLELLRKSMEVGKRLLAPLNAAEQATFIALLTRLCEDERADAGGEADEAVADSAAVDASI